MIYRVKVSPVAEAEIDACIHYIAVENQEPLNAAKVLSAIRAEIPTLGSFPNRCPLAPENADVERTIRVLSVKRSLYVLYWVDEPNRTVYVEGFRHAKQPRLDLGDRLSGH